MFANLMMFNKGLPQMPLNMVNICGTGFMIGERAKYTANTGQVSISTANTNLDGTGTLGTVITAPKTAFSKGTLIKTITIKSQVNTTDGMVRLFVYDGTNTRLLLEVPVKAVTKSASADSFHKVINLNYYLEENCSIKASTEKAETFSIIAEGLDITYPA